ncbi:pantoate kinase [Halorubrum halodurans]|uniref:Pantoate kinase n=1 Tax=Halorubrum halodurans TaxID=1383851 RepID=A0A256IRS0_9EURY|nr:pantoate kinase [Halorubrum halodurans]OYR58986.1 sugar kinase [Halorubrum halodurans]
MNGKRATAFVPGHVTAFFSAHPAADPAVAGSRGAGLTLSDGVDVTVETIDDPEALAAGDASATADASAPITLDGEPASIGAVADVLAALDVCARVDVETDLPLGAGFGVSGAAALGTALAANAVADRGRSENELVRIAHEAEVERGTGLGDVVAQARGGVPIRLEPGAPGHGALDGIPAHARIEYVTFGELSTEAVLAGDTAALTAAGERALSRLRADPRLPTLMDASREFAARADLLVPEVAEAIEAVDRASDPDGDGTAGDGSEGDGGSAAMAMLGRTVFALGTGLSDAGYDPAVCHTHPAGARLLENSDNRHSDNRRD